MSLPNPTFAGQKATVAGKTYEAVSVDPPVWKGVTTGTHGARIEKLEVKSRVSVTDFGALGIGVDDTAAIDAAVQSLTASGVPRTLYFPKTPGHYVYNGTGINLPNNCSIEFENNETILNASGNTNTGYVITLNGFRSIVEGGYIIGNPSNPLLLGVSSTYNTELGGVRDMIIENFHYSIDIDKAWYVLFDNIRFRATVPLQGAYIRIGYNSPTLEVNNIDFRNVWMGEQQQHSVAIYCPIQTIKFSGGSLESKGGARIKFFNTTPVNTFVLDGMYIEGDCGPDNIYLIEGQSQSQEATLRDCLVRLGPTEGTLGKNVTIIFDNCWSNSPNVSIIGNGQRIFGTPLGRFPFFKGGVFPYNAGLWDGTKVNNGDIQMTPKMMDWKDINATIPTYINFKSHTAANTPLPVFKVFVPSLVAGSSGPRLMRLTLKVLVKAKVDNFVQGLEQYDIAITLPRATADVLSGTLVTKVFSGVTSAASLLSDPSVTLEYNGFNSTAGGEEYTIRHEVSNPTRLGDCVFELSGSYIDSELSEVVRSWKVQKL